MKRPSFQFRSGIRNKASYEMNEKCLSANENSFEGFVQANMANEAGKNENNTTENVSQNANQSQISMNDMFKAFTEVMQQNNAFRYQAGGIYDALFELSEDSRTDAYGKNAALGMARKIKNFKFVCCLVIWHTILFRINIYQSGASERNDKYLNSNSND